METAARLLAPYDLSDALLLEVRVLPAEVELLCDFGVVAGEAASMNRLVRLRLSNPRNLRLDFAVPGAAADEVSQQLGRIAACYVSGMTMDASVRLVSAYGQVETEHCALAVEPFPWS